MKPTEKQSKSRKNYLKWDKKNRFVAVPFSPASFNISHLCALMISINRNHIESDMGMMNKHEMNVI